MEKITYGAPRLVDWVAQIKAGAATVRVHFTGGALTSYGVTPAEFTTSNPFIQKVIEQSSYFKEGRITLLRRIKIADTEKSTKFIKAKPQPKPAPAPTPKAPEPTPEAPAATQPTEGVTEAVEATPVTELTPSVEDEVNAAIEETTKETADGLKTVEVSCLQDAQAYLQENFNIPSYKIRTRPTAQKAASEHDIMFVGGGFVPVGAEDAEAETAEEE